SVWRGRRSRPGSSPRNTPPPYRTASPPTLPTPAPTGTPSRWRSRRPCDTRRVDSSEPRLRDQAGLPQRQQGADTAASLRRAADNTRARRALTPVPGCGLLARPRADRRGIHPDCGTLTRLDHAPCVLPPRRQDVQAGLLLRSARQALTHALHDRPDDASGVLQGGVRLLRQAHLELGRRLRAAAT